MGDGENQPSGCQPQKQRRQQRRAKESETMDGASSGSRGAVSDAWPFESPERRTPRPRKQRLTTWNRRPVAVTKHKTPLHGYFQFSCADAAAETERYLLRARYVRRDHPPVPAPLSSSLTDRLFAGCTLFSAWFTLSIYVCYMENIRKHHTSLFFLRLL